MSFSRSLELRIPPMAVWSVSACAMAIIHPDAIGSITDLSFRWFAGWLVFICGGAVALAGVRAFRTHSTTVNPLTPDRSTALVRSGVYRISRHPMYLGMLLMLAGFGLVLSYAGSWVVPLLFTAYITRFQIVPEERSMLERFGDSYRGYMNVVRRWV